MKPGVTNIVGTFRYWRFDDYKNFTSLKLLAAAMGIPLSKDNIDGSMDGVLFLTVNSDDKKLNMQCTATHCQKTM